MSQFFVTNRTILSIFFITLEPILQCFVKCWPSIFLSTSTSFLTIFMLIEHQLFSSSSTFTLFFFWTNFTYSIHNVGGYHSHHNQSPQQSEKTHRYNNPEDQNETRMLQAHWHTQTNDAITLRYRYKFAKLFGLRFNSSVRGEKKWQTIRIKIPVKYYLSAVYSWEPRHFLIYTWNNVFFLKRENTRLSP